MNKKENIVISFDKDVDTGDIEKFNYNTLEPKMFKANNYDLNKFNTILGTDIKNNDDMYRHMKGNKVICALKFFEENKETIVFPDYINTAIKNEE
ncbi:hypothetical protein Dip510_001456 [Elusimicrobium posterum]|uniref:hypothetical protein n=1 Tax=Elusimicrobium posterum TaxID=3116653 RepID=UPI003C76A450